MLLVPLIGFTLFILVKICSYTSSDIHCSTLWGKFLDHDFERFQNKRVCKICGLYQEREYEFFAMLGDDPVWFNRGYVEDIEKTVKYFKDLNTKKENREKNRKIEKISKTKNNIISFSEIEGNKDDE